MLYRVLCLSVLAGIVGCSSEQSAEVEVSVEEQPVAENKTHFLSQQQKVLENAKQVERMLLEADAKRKQQIESTAE